MNSMIHLENWDLKWEGIPTVNKEEYSIKEIVREYRRGNYLLEINYQGEIPLDYESFVEMISSNNLITEKEYRELI